MLGYKTVGSDLMLVSIFDIPDLKRLSQIIVKLEHAKEHSWWEHDQT